MSGDGISHMKPGFLGGIGGTTFKPARHMATHYVYVTLGVTHSTHRTKLMATQIIKSIFPQSSQPNSLLRPPLAAPAYNTAWACCHQSTACNRVVPTPPSTELPPPALNCCPLPDNQHLPFAAPSNQSSCLQAASSPSHLKYPLAMSSVSGCVWLWPD